MSCTYNIEIVVIPSKYVGPNTSMPCVEVISHNTWTADAIRTILGRFGPYVVDMTFKDAGPPEAEEQFCQI